jgi:hypothetical protein
VIDPSSASGEVAKRRAPGPHRPADGGSGQAFGVAADLVPTQPQHREITAYSAMLADFSVRTLAPCVLAAAGLPGDAADLAQLPEITPETFGWPGLLGRPDRILTAAAGVLLETFLSEHRRRPVELPEVYQLLREWLSPEVVESVEDARIWVFPHLLGQHAYYAISVGVQLLHVRYGRDSAELQHLRDCAQVAFLDLHQQVGSWRLGQAMNTGPAEYPAVARTAWLLPVRVPPQDRAGT